MRWLVAIGLCATACGDDGTDPDSCQPAGTSEGPWMRAAQVTVDTMHALVFDEVEGTCGEIASSGGSHIRSTRRWPACAAATR